MERKLFAAFLVLFLSIGLSNAIATQSLSLDLSRANKLFTDAKYSDALPLYQRILGSPSKDVPLGTVCSRIGDCYFRLGNYKSALQFYRDAFRNQKPSEQAPTQYWIGFCSFLLNNDAEAMAEFLKIPERYPRSGMWVSTAYYWAGRVSERMGNKEQAADYYRRAAGKGTTTQERFALKKAETVKSK
jgi:TolA-binding protein